MDLSNLPAVNATLNSIAFVLLICGFACIRRKRVLAHKRFMISAYCVSALFLISYLTHRFTQGEYRFGGEGLIRPVYFFILISHVLLALTVPFIATTLLVLGLRGRFELHKRIARVGFPIWVYVSITGVLVYFMLFQLYEPIPPA